ncbi:aspartate aminotransferase family protein [Ferrovum sp. PN-J185]|uniref:aspartate aminotransferase family protein n=1 Tax=Ferrovum sp. PN-J185 TaxID=1356306 RepID=UPI00079C9F4A|nr:aspartate aminotransferase family protein [Ferrovum sp. PN-J185]KXW55680.1 acetylornithine aminotransferase [Ferrovum sp. PN-J185]
MSHLMNTYARQPIAFTKGKGAWLWDENDRPYLDALSGIAVNGVGHAHPKLVKAISEQAQQLIHTSNIYHVLKQEELADKLCAVAHMDNAFFCSSGAEANEAAIKLARLYGHQKGIEQPTIIVMEKAWHGRTIATLSATGSRKAQAGFEPLVAGFVRVPFNDLDAIRAVAQNNRNIVAVLLEPIQGEGGIRVAETSYMQALRQLCTENDWLFMIDEVQTGIGRTGHWFAFEEMGVKPDVLALAKGLGSGLPIGACLASGKAADVFKPGNHGTTFGGGPLVCAGAIATLEIMAEERLADNAATLGHYMKERLINELMHTKGVIEVRGKGLMLGIELDRPCGELVAQAINQGLLINVTSDKVVRLLPPLIINKEEAAQIVDGVVSLIKAFLNG